MYTGMIAGGCIGLLFGLVITSMLAQKKINGNLDELSKKVDQIEAVLENGNHGLVSADRDAK